MKTKRYLSVLIGGLLSANAFAAMNIQPDPTNPNGYIIARADIQAVEKSQTSDPMYAIWSKALETRPNTIVEAIQPGLTTNPENVKRVERVFPQTEWDFLTHMAAPEYSYTRFLRAIGKFPAFCGEYTDGRDSDAICKKSIVTAFAHFAQETGGHVEVSNVSDNPLGLEKWQQALFHVREMGWAEGQEGYTTGCGSDDWQNRRWPCEPGQGYFGRGAKQLSYHFNYGAFSEVMFDGDATVLLKNPALVADSWLNMASAIWFFLTPQAPKPAMLHVIDRTWKPSQREIEAGIGYGFGTTINVINGGIECGEHNKTKGQPVNRISYWEGLAAHYQIPIEADEKNTCYQQTPFGSLNLKGSTDVLYTNWDGNWKHYPERPGGASFECELVPFQTAYSALVPGDYEKCVTNFYGSHSIWPEVRIVDKAIPVEPGAGAEPPVDGVAGWDVNKVYNKGDKAARKGVVYQAKNWTQGDDPALGGAWEVFNGTTTPTPPPTNPNGFIEWQEGVSQVANGDKVTHAGKCYIAKNNPGVWDTPGSNPNSGWNWDQISCK
ncbi:glycoside hydrolase family 19 protein [Vibrio nigripulchritudo]|uniref:glycoside hydrolase family 19 protein n=1 Tax=Vibrio nigripulchritudo TaxID=28173 RepID=UPI0003B20355|nr:glycoside hydrolase family 19 protein [Vibrio nigripulchritudo]KJY78989.1 carbohydrate-binding protein [Vibrio nigripulchritudo]CCN72500.1 Chitinase [Vibrio nigripulchritudo SFn118]BCL71381.1 chitinase [Vibrio nigripulchritudo]BDU32738.1 chitinase [Vibrio nigripulchritudo]BDU38781.1 chitinase [Vibrio nigripulchritudo]